MERNPPRRARLPSRPRAATDGERRRIAMIRLFPPLLVVAAHSTLVGAVAFAQPPLFPNPRFDIGRVPVAIDAANLDGDGHVDAATANASTNDVTFIRGDGLGNLAAVAHVAVGTAPMGIRLADFDGDGIADAFVPNAVSHDVSLLRGGGAQGLTPLSTTPVGTTIESFDVADLDLDGDLDAVVARKATGAGAVVPMVSNGNGAFTLHPAALVPAVKTLRVGDVTGD